MSDKDKAMQQALEALECMIDDLMYKDHKRVIDISNVAITALRTALEQQQAEPPPEWLLIKNILDEYGLQAIDFVAEFKAAQQQAEPTCPDCKAAVLYECVACSSNNYPPKQQAEPPQRQWVGLEIEEVQDSYNSDYQAQTRAVEKLLKERNA